jgi:hypothetical protein
MVTVAERERVLEEMVRDWARPEFGGEPGVLDRAVGVALEGFHAGESVPEAWKSACLFLQSWSRHPAQAGLHHLDPAA